MTQVSLPYNIQPNTPEDITQVMANLNAIVAVVNGQIDDGNVAAANKDGAVGVPSLRTLGTGALQAAAGNDARLSDGRMAKGIWASVPQITADQNDYAPGAFTTSTNLIYVSADAPRSITGLAGGADGRIVTIVNASINAITLKHNSGSSAAANRFFLESSVDLVIPGAGAASLVYQAGPNLWFPYGRAAPVDAAAAIPSLRTLGTGATQAAAGTDSRFSGSSGDFSARLASAALSVIGAVGPGGEAGIKLNNEVGWYRSAADTIKSINNHIEAVLDVIGNRYVRVGTAAVPASGVDKGIVISNITGPGPPNNPVGGGYLYVEAGALKYRGSSGNQTTIAIA